MKLPSKAEYKRKKAKVTRSTHALPQSRISPAPSDELAQMSISAYAQKLTPQLRSILERIYSRIEVELDDIPITSLPMVAGIIQEKLRHLNQDVAPQSRSVLLVGGISRSQALELLGLTNPTKSVGINFSADKVSAKQEKTVLDI
jgi:hypothetical protein